MTPKEITQEVERRFEAEQNRPYSRNGSPRKAKRRIRVQVERELAADKRSTYHADRFLTAEALWS